LGYLSEFLIGAILVTLGWFFFTEVLPRWMASRAAKPPEQQLSTLPGVESQPIIPIGAETSIESNRITHDAFLSEAADLILRARGAELFAEDLLREAAEKAQDAIKLRPGSFDANLLAGEIGVKRAMLADDVEAIELLEEAAVRFATATETKKGVIDAYVGRAWSHLERAQRLDDDRAPAAYLDAAEVFLKGFRVSPQNLFILRGWGMAIDGLARAVGETAESVRAAEDAYRLALAEHRGGDHELHAWYAEIRAAAEPVRTPMPAVRDLY
jgi:hypothetical protein